jgi:hypothetical protein
MAQLGEQLAAGAYTCFDFGTGFAQRLITQMYFEATS